MNFGSLFAGIGGLDLGLERAGMVCQWQVEIDDYCSRVLAKHWPDVRRYGDVRECGARNLEPVDLICGGFPCQPHSVAGKRKGAADDRNLWPEYLRIVAELRPRYVLAENVPGIVTTYLDTVLSDLEGEGYTCTTFNLPACAFDASHRRERIFVVAHANGTRKLQPQRSEPDKRGRVGNESEAVANTEGTGTPAAQQQGRSRSIEQDSEAMADASSEGLSDGWQGIEGGSQSSIDGSGESWRSTQSALCRVATRVSEELDDIGGINDADAKKSRSRKDMHILRKDDGAEAIQRNARRQRCVPETEILQPKVHGPGIYSGGCNEGNTPATGAEVCGQEMRNVQPHGQTGGTPQEREYQEQCGWQPDDIVRFLSHEMALETWQETLEKTVGVQNLWRACAEIGHVPEALSAIPEIWRSLIDEEKAWIGLRISSGSPWCVEWPGVARVATGVPDRAAKLRVLGNAVVPDVAEWIGRRIMEVERNEINMDSMPTL